MTKKAEFIDKLRLSGLRPTKQRLKICLFYSDLKLYFSKQYFY